MQLERAVASQIARRQYQYMDESSGVGVVDKSVAVLSALEGGPASLAALVTLTGLPRPTAHRLAVALERHRLVARDTEGRFVLGPRLGELAAAGGEDRLIATAAPILAKLRDSTGESTQLYRRQGDVRVCVAAAELPAGLRRPRPAAPRCRGCRVRRPDSRAGKATGVGGQRRRTPARRGVGLGAGQISNRSGDRRGLGIRTDRATHPQPRQVARPAGRLRGRGDQPGPATLNSPTLSSQLETADPNVTDTVLWDPPRRNVTVTVEFGVAA
jgi:hypothetical protein